MKRSMVALVLLTASMAVFSACGSTASTPAQSTPAAAETTASAGTKTAEPETFRTAEETQAGGKCSGSRCFGKPGSFRLQLKYRRKDIPSRNSEKKIAYKNTFAIPKIGKGKQIWLVDSSSFGDFSLGVSSIVESALCRYTEATFKTAGI